MAVLKDYWPQFFPYSWIKESNVYGIPFTNDVAIGFVIRKNGHYTYLLQDDFKSLVCTSDELLNSALNILAENNNGVEIKTAKPPKATVVWINADDNFIAVRLLLPKFQSFLRKEVGDKILFTIPTRDLLLCWNEDAPVEITTKHINEARADFARYDYSLSPHVFIYNQKWPCKEL